LVFYSVICIPKVYLPSAGEPWAIQGLTRRGGSFNFCLLKNIDFIQQDPQLRIQPCIAMGAAHGCECE
jgi:hypothetical protein